MNEKEIPLRFRLVVLELAGRETFYQYGCYFPKTDLCVTDMGQRSTGKPQGVEWLDAEATVIKPPKI